MSGAYDGAGKRISSKTHARRGHQCPFCARTVFGNGGQVSHARSHVTRGEAVEMLKEYATYPPITSRLFLASDDPRIHQMLSEGYTLIDAGVAELGRGH